MLTVADLNVRYGVVHAVRSASLLVRKGEIVAVVGPNGAGKSTLLNAIMGLVPRVGGRIRYQDREVPAGRTETLVRRGMTLVPEGRRVFSSLTVAETLRVAWAGRRRNGSVEETERRKIFELFPILEGRHNQLASELSGGEAQQLALARALMTQPLLLLLDEPSLGLAPVLCDLLFKLLVDLRDAGHTMLLVEQSVFRALEIADRAYVMSSGQLSSSQPAEKLLSDPSLVHSYLGVGGRFDR